MAEKCRDDTPNLAKDLGVEPEVVEAACLAHDLGHPPFGHVGEKALDGLVTRDGNGDRDGFEGNAQSFRTLTRLGIRFDDCDGLNLTRATLCATLKYPWLRDASVPKKKEKWGAFRADQDDFWFARLGEGDKEEQSAEAALMDWADDIAYSVHDLEDFHRCGAIPWNHIFDPDNEADLVRRTQSNWFEAPRNAEALLTDALRRIRDFIRYQYSDIVKMPYEGTSNQRRQLRQLTSFFIGRYVQATKLDADEPNGLSIREDEQLEVRVLKQITREYVITKPALIAQQVGQKKILEDLFEAIRSDSPGAPPRFLPARLRYLYEFKDQTSERVAADCICSLTENECVGLHHRLTGIASGSVLDPIVR